MVKIIAGTKTSAVPGKMMMVLTTLRFISSYTSLSDRTTAMPALTCFKCFDCVGYLIQVIFQMSQVIYH